MRRLTSLQYLRGVAACGVVAYHAADRAGLSFAPGEAGVDLFFVLSGFLMWAITGADSRPGPFLADRLKRIVPSYWIATTAMLGGALLGLFPAVRLTVEHIAASYLFLPAISPSNGQVWPLLVPGWTLEYEAGFYLLFGLALCLPRALQLGALTAVLAGLAMAHPWLAKGEVALRFYSNPHILEFLGGLWLGEIHRRERLLRPAAAPLLFTCALALGAAALLLPPDWPKPARYGAPALLIVAAVLALERRPEGVPDIAVLRRLGDASYSIYLWHTLAMSVTAKAAGLLHLPPTIAIPIHFAAGTGVGLVAYALIERPIMAALRRPPYMRGAPVPGGV